MSGRRRRRPRRPARRLRRRPATRRSSMYVSAASASGSTCAWSAWANVSRSSDSRLSASCVSTFVRGGATAVRRRGRGGGGGCGEAGLGRVALGRQHLDAGLREEAADAARADRALLEDDRAGPELVTDLRNDLREAPAGVRLHPHARLPSTASATVPTASTCVLGRISLYERTGVRDIACAISARRWRRTLGCRRRRRDGRARRRPRPRRGWRGRSPRRGPGRGPDTHRRWSG